MKYSKLKFKFLSPFNKTVAGNIVGNDSLTEIESSKEIYATLSYELGFFMFVREKTFVHNA